MVNIWYEVTVQKDSGCEFSYYLQRKHKDRATSLEDLKKVYNEIEPKLRAKGYTIKKIAQHRELK